MDLEAIYQVLAFVAKYPKTQVEFGAFNANPEQLGSLQNQVEKMIEERLSPEAFEEVVESSGAENKLEENNEIVSRFLSKTCVTRLPLSRPFSLHDLLST